MNNTNDNFEYLEDFRKDVIEINRKQIDPVKFQQQVKRLLKRTPPDATK